MTVECLYDDDEEDDDGHLRLILKELSHQLTPDFIINTMTCFLFFSSSKMLVLLRFN